MILVKKHNDTYKCIKIIDQYCHKELTRASLIGESEAGLHLIEALVQ